MSSVRTIKRNLNLKRWAAIIADRNTTDLTVDEYCKRNNLSRHSYFYWLRLLRQEYAGIGTNDSVPVEACVRKFYGATYLLDRISEVTGICIDLLRCFGSIGDEILSIAYYLVLEEGQPMYRFHKWGITHKHPFGEDIPSQRNSEIFGMVTENLKMDYFKRQAKRHGVKTSLKIVSRGLDKIRDDFVTRFNYNSEMKLYIQSFTEEWNYTEERPRTGETISEKRRIYLHYYNNDQKATDDKDLIEKSFGNLKERLDMRRMSVASEENFEGKLFVQFVALQLLSYIKKQMDDNGLFKNYTMQSLLDELDIIEYYQHPGKAHHLSEITEKQRKLYEIMQVSVPT